MKLFTQEISKQLDHNGRLSHPIGGDCDPEDLKPVVRLFTPDAQASWLLLSTDPNYPDFAFGLCDLGLGFPELGNVIIAELTKVRGALGLPIERDLHFSPSKTLREYAEMASEAGQIVT